MSCKLLHILRPIPKASHWHWYLENASGKIAECNREIGRLLANYKCKCNTKRSYLISNWILSLLKSGLNHLVSHLRMSLCVICRLTMGQLSKEKTFKKIFWLLFHYSCPHFSPITLPCPTHTPLSTFNPLPSPIGFVHGSFIRGAWHMVLDPSPTFPCYPLSPLLWSLSVCSLFPCLWLYIACLFVLLIRFHLLVKSYGICLWLWQIMLLH